MKYSLLPYTLFIFLTTYLSIFAVANANEYNKKHVFAYSATMNLDEYMEEISYQYQLPWAFSTSARFMRNKIEELNCCGEIQRDGIALGIAKNFYLNNRWVFELSAEYAYFYKENESANQVFPQSYDNEFYTEFLAEHGYGDNHKGLLLNAGVALRLYKGIHLGLTAEYSTAAPESKGLLGMTLGYRF